MLIPQILGDLRDILLGLKSESHSPYIGMNVRNAYDNVMGHGQLRVCNGRPMAADRVLYITHVVYILALYILLV